MDTAAHRRCLRALIPYTPAPANHKPPEIENARTHTCLAMRGGAISIRISRLNPARPRRPFCVRATTAAQNSMDDREGDAAKKTQATQPIEAAKSKEEELKPVKEAVPPPPPPEKPEPGDCCGSGCVRCVWDVYYDELDEYNKLYKSDENSNS